MRIRDLRGLLPWLVGAGVLAACTIGTEFVRPSPDFVRLGETTFAQIVERFGKPQGEDQIREDGRTVRRIAYFFGSEMEAPKVPGTVCLRILIFGISEDIVVGEGFTSTCASDHTDFDARKSAEIIKDKTRCDEVTAMLGRPNVREIYPAIDRKGHLSIGYSFSYMTRPGQKIKSYDKSLAILCDSDGVVRETAFTESTVP